MPPPTTSAHRFRPPLLTGISLLLLAAGSIFVRSQSSGRADHANAGAAAGSGENDLSENNHPTSSPSDTSGPARTKRPRPPDAHAATSEEDLTGAATIPRESITQFCCNSNGKLVPGLMRLQGVSESQIEEAQKLLDRKWTEMARLAGGRLAYDSAASQQAGDGAVVFRLPALREVDVDLELDTLRQSLEDVTSADTARDIMTSVKTLPTFGHMGRYDCVCTILPGEARAAEPGAPAGEDRQVTMDFYDPDTGEQQDPVTGTLGEINGTHGNIFHLPP